MAAILRVEKAERRVLVTGAAGFVGGHVLRELLGAGYGEREIVALARPGEAAPGAFSNAVFVDIADRDAAAQIVGRIRPTAIIHLAAIAEPAKARADERAAWRVNFLGVMNLAEALFAAGAEGRFIFAGSSDAYGETFRLVTGPVTEEHPLRPMNVYAATKAAADLYLGRMADQGLHVVRLRPFNHTGPGQAPNFVAPAFARQIARIEKGLAAPVIDVGNLEARRDFLDVRDVARAYVAAIDKPGTPDSHSVYNLASGVARRVGDMLDALLAMSPAKIAVKADPARLRADDLPQTLGDAAKAGRELGWRPQIPFAQTLADVLADWRMRAAP